MLNFVLMRSVFCRGVAKMIDGSEKRKRQLAFQRQNSGV